MRLNSLVTVLVLILMAVLAIPSAAVTWPAYENTHRDMGRVTELYSTTVGSQPWAAFVIAHPDSSPARYDCDTRAHALACDQLAIGDYVLVSGHTESYGGGLSCRWDGSDYLLVPNALWNCNAWKSSGGVLPCIQLTP